MHVDDLRRLGRIDGLGDDQLLELIAVGVEVQFSPGEQLFHEKDPADF